MNPGFSNRLRHAVIRSVIGLGLIMIGPPVVGQGNEPKPKLVFEANIDRVFDGDDLADVRVIFGYDNWKDLEDPSDPGRARNLMVFLGGRGFSQIICTEAWAQELGVPVGAQNLRVFEGPGQKDQKLRVSLIWSAATSKTAKNIGPGYSRQLKCSNEALKFMQKAHESADAVVYVGHSRDGGGPDTFPPQTVLGDPTDSQRVDFKYYRTEKPGLNSLKGHFGKTPGKPHFIAWTGCISERFQDWMADQMGKRATPASVILSSRLSRSMPWVDAFEGVDEALMLVTRFITALQTHQDQASFEKAMAECELSDMREPEHPEWHLHSIPSAKLK